MTRTEFIAELRAIADDIEKEGYHFAEIGENKLFCNKNFGEIWVKFNDDCRMSISLFTATDEEKGASK